MTLMKRMPLTFQSHCSDKLLPCSSLLLVECRANSPSLPSSSEAAVKLVTTAASYSILQYCKQIITCLQQPLRGDLQSHSPVSVCPWLLNTWCTDRPLFTSLVYFLEKKSSSLRKVQVSKMQHISYIWFHPLLPMKRNSPSCQRDV